MNGTAPSPLMVPLSPTIRDRARAFAAEQATPEKGLRVYLNTLAVWAVHCYLKWLYIETDVARGDSWNPALRAIFDVGDLVVPHWGKLECRPVLAGEDAIALSPEATQNRKGYIAVQFNNSLQEAYLLGFYPASTLEMLDSIPLRQLQPLDVLLESIPESEVAPVRLNQWLQNIFATGWQAVEEFLTPQTPAFAFRRNSIRRAKQLELDYSLILLVTIQPENRDNLAIHLQIFPAEPTSVLPFPTRFTVLTETGEVFREILSKEGNRFIQYELSGRVGEQFTLEVVSGSAAIRESFVV
jgi:Protein of unknown function (DUF1822)